MRSSEAAPVPPAAPGPPPAEKLARPSEVATSADRKAQRNAHHLRETQRRANHEAQPVAVGEPCAAAQQRGLAGTERGSGHEAQCDAHHLVGTQRAAPSTKHSLLPSAGPAPRPSDADLQEPSAAPTTKHSATPTPAGQRTISFQDSPLQHTTHLGHFHCCSPLTKLPVLGRTGQKSLIVTKTTHFAQKKVCQHRMCYS